jgi:quinol monooxygenase YgiN
MGTDWALRMSLITSFIAKPGKEDELAKALQDLIAPVRKEPGCLHLSIYQDGGDRRRFFAVETFADQRALDSHRTMSYAKEFGEVIAPRLVASQSVTHCNELPETTRSNSQAGA